MWYFGFEYFYVCVYDCGVWVVYWFVFDYVDVVEWMMLFDIVLMFVMYEKIDCVFVIVYFYWFFLI